MVPRTVTQVYSWLREYMSIIKYSDEPKSIDMDNIVCFIIIRTTLYIASIAN